jgi:hypothetical protein
MKKSKNIQKTRAHLVLFLSDTPFKPQRVELKTRYKRREKHPQKNTFG